jgi:hypothetical protein
MNLASRLLAALGLKTYREKTAANAGGVNLKFELIDVFTIEAPAVASRIHLSRPIVGDLRSALG